MTLTDTQKQAEDARAQGNTSYKSGDLPRAIEWYQKAHQLDPQASSPLANLAAATFELGQYEESIKYAEQALSLLSDDEAGEKSRVRLNVRSFRAHLLLKQYASAQTIATRLSSDKVLGEEYQQVSEKLSKVLDQANSAQTSHDRHISPFKPTVGESSQFEIVGEDTPASLFDASLLSKDGRDLSFFFANFGDARHVFATLIHLADPAITKPADLQSHFALCDARPVNVARLLVVLSILEALATEDAQARSSKALAVLFHTYITPIIPADLYEKLQHHISKVKDALQNKTPLPLSLTIHNRENILEVLRFWSEDAQERFPAAWVRETLEEKLIDTLNPDIELFPAGLRKEAKLFRKTCVLRSSLDQGIARDTVAQLTSLTSEKLSLDSTSQQWRSNVTLLVDSKSPWQGLVFDPFDFGSRVATREIQGTVILADVISEWLLKVAKAVKTLTKSIQIELHASTAILPSLSTSSITSRDESVQRLYDRIHLSSLPDLTGGTLYVYLFSVAHLKPGQTSYVTWKSSLYSEVFTSWRDYDLEFLAIQGDKAGTSTVERLFLVRPDGEVHAEDAGSSLFTSSSISGFRRARPTTHNKLKHEQLLPRAQLTTWLYRILLKLTLPHIDRTVVTPEVLSPLNLSVFVRLIARLYNIGYPAHWLLDVLDSIQAGVIRTSARQPGSNPLKLKEAKSALAERDISTSFIALELQSLLGAMGGEIGFGSLYDAPQDLQSFSITFEGVKPMKEAWATYVLVLDQTAINDEEGLALSKQRAAHLANAKVISTFDWDSRSKVAQFHLSTTTMSSLVESKWYITLWHLESWSALSERRPVSECLSKSAA